VRLSPGIDDRHVCGDVRKNDLSFFELNPDLS